MSSSSLNQLAESYSKILAATLKHVRETGLLRDAGREVLDELECRWRAAAGRELAAMEARQEKNSGAAPGGQRPSGIAALITGGPSMLTPQEGRFDGTPSIMSDTLKKRPPSHFAHMSGVTFAEPFELPALHGRPPVPALQCSGGFGGSHVETPTGPGVLGQVVVGGGSVGGAAQTEAQPLQKKARRGQRETEPAPLAKPLAPPLDATGPSRREAVAPASGTPSPAPAPAADAASDDEEYDGCFDGAEVIVSSAAENNRQHAQSSEQEGAVVPADGAASPAPSDDRPESSRGSELGSDLDDSEFDEPDTENVLHAKIARVVKQKKQKWELYFEEGVLMVNGTECLFKSGRGHFSVEEAETAEALEDEAPADAVLADGA